MADYNKERFDDLQKRIEILESTLKKEFGIIVKDFQKKEVVKEAREIEESEEVFEVKETFEVAVDQKFSSAVEENRRPVKKASNLEAQIGGRLLNIIGVVALILGVAFFVGYAFQNNWIGPAGRIALGYVAAVILLFLGDWWRKKYPKYSQGLTGGGLATLYVTTYSAFSFYHLIGSLPAYILMILTTVAAVLLAVRYNSEIIAYIGLTGGFLTPFVIGSSSGVLSLNDQVKLFAYLIILNIGIVILSYFKKWKALSTGAFLVSILSYTIWFAVNYKSAYFAPALFFTIALFFIYLLVPIMPKLSKIEEDVEPFDILIFLINPLFFFVTTLGLYNWNRVVGAALSIILALIYVAAAYIIRNSRKDLKSAILIFFGIALSFLTIAIPFIWDLHWLTIAWAVEAVVLIYVGLIIKNAYLKSVGVVLLALVALRVVTLSDSAGLARTSVVFVTVIACFYSAAFLYYKFKEQISQEEQSLSVVGVIGANVLTVWWLSYLAINIFKSSGFGAGRFMSASIFSLSLVWGFYAAALVGIGIIYKLKLSRYMGLALLGVTIFKLFFVDLSGLETVYRIISFIVLGLLMLVLSFSYQKYKDFIL